MESLEGSAVEEGIQAKRYILASASPPWPVILFLTVKIM